MEPLMTCDANAATGGASSSQRGTCDSGDPAETRRITGVPLRLATDHIIVDITSEASTAYLVRRDTGAPDVAETGASPIPWGSDFCAMLLAMLSHDLRQPLQIIMAAHDALDLRLAGELERRQLARIERAAAQVAEKLELLLRRCGCARTRARPNSSRYGSTRFSRSLPSNSAFGRGRSGSSFVSRQHMSLCRVNSCC